MTEPVVSDMQRLLIIEACRTLIHRYAYLNDLREFAQLAELFTEQAMLIRPSSPHQPIVGRADILQALMTRPASTATFHVCSDIMVEVISATQARAQSRILMLSGTRPEHDGHPDPGTLKPLLPGVFQDELVLTAAGWRFARRAGGLWLSTLQR